MKAEAVAIGKILQPTQRFVVPIYQRNYQWGEDKLSRLWDDIEAKAVERLDGKARRFVHYMGALLLLPSRYEMGRVPIVEVVDGQQRLTTFQILLASLRSIASDKGLTQAADQLKVYLFNGDETLMKKPKVERYKLEPTQIDRAMFRDLVDQDYGALRKKYGKDFFYKNGNLKTGAAPLSLRAWWFFREKANSFFTDNGNDPAEVRGRLDGLARTIIEDFHIVQIELGEGDDAQVIFETLNGQSEPLLAKDLIRNDIYYRVGRLAEFDENATNEEKADIIKQRQEDLFESGWKQFETPFWGESQRQGRYKKPRIELFIAQALAAETGDEISIGKIYAEYRAAVKRGLFSDPLAEISTFTRHGETYRTLVAPSADGPLSVLAKRLQDWDLSTAYPLVMCIEASADVASETKADLYTLVYSYVVRRGLCDLTPKNLNNTFLRLTRALKKDGVSVATFAKAFVDQDGDSVRFPSDDEMRRKVPGTRLYYRLPTQRIRRILSDLELASRTKMDEDVSISAALQVEHIMPQAWKANWPLSKKLGKAPTDPIAVTSEEMREAIERRENAIHTLGNLTLLTPSANAAAGSAPFVFAEPSKARGRISKRDRLNDSLLKMNREVARLDVWSEAEIRDRGVTLIELSLSVYPTPERLLNR